MKTPSRRRRSTKRASGDPDKPELGIKHSFLPELLTPEELADLQREFREDGEWMRQELQRQKVSKAK